MEITDEIRRSPQYHQYYYAQQKKDQENAMAAQDARRLAHWAKTSEYEGQTEIPLGLPSTKENLQAREASGIYAENFNPRERQLALRNKAMLGSGLPDLQEQAMSNMGSMQTSAMSGINQLKLAKYNKANPGQGAPTAAHKNLMARGLKPGTPEFQKAMKTYMDKSGVNVNMNSEQLDPGWMSDEVKESQNIPKSHAIWIDATGKATTINKPDAAVGKTAIALEQMLGATSNLNKVLKDYNPNSLVEIGTQMFDVNPTVAGLLRTQTERTINSEKKSWAEMVLRDATGAVINPSEYKDYDQIYMPQAGETPEEWERKARTRHDKENAYRVRTGLPEAEYVSPYPEFAEAENNKTAENSPRKFRPLSEMSEEEKQAELAELRKNRAGGK